MVLLLQKALSVEIVHAIVHCANVSLEHVAQPIIKWNRAHKVYVPSNKVGLQDPDLQP